MQFFKPRTSLTPLLCVIFAGSLMAQVVPPQEAADQDDPFRQSSEADSSSERPNLYQQSALDEGASAEDSSSQENSASAENILEKNLLNEIVPEEENASQELTLSGRPERRVIDESAEEENTSPPADAADAEAELLQNVSEGFEVMEQMKFIPEQTERPDLLAFRQRGRPLEIKPYYLESGQPGDPTHTTTRELASYFLIEPETAAALSTKALEATRELLRESSVQVITRNRRVRTYNDDSPIYAFVYVNGRPLEEYLLERGLVKPEGEQAVSPTGMQVGQYYGRLRSLERKARHDEAGGWKKDESVIRADRRILD
jgi:hypothetical protein